MTTITKERIELFIKNPLENGLTRAEQMELARIALASLEAEPIGAFHIADQQVGGTSDYIKDGEWPIDNGVIEVYAVPPVLVVPEERPSLNNGIVGFDEGWNACRAAMLLGSQPVSNHGELPYAQVKAAADLYALCWQSGEVVTYTPAPEKATIWLNNYSGTCVQEYVKLERLQEALTGNSPVIPDCSFSGLVNSARALLDALYEFGADEVDISEYVTNLEDALRVAAAPVDPQVTKYEQIMLQAGWVMVPVEPTDEMIAAAMECDDVVFDSKDPTAFCVQYREIYYAMVDVAPKPEEITDELA